MEINLGNGFGVSHDALNVGVGGAGRGTLDAPKASRLSPNITIGMGPEALASAEPTVDVPDSALSRDDDIGRLVNAAFSLPPPPMPDFGN